LEKPAVGLLNFSGIPPIGFGLEWLFPLNREFPESLKVLLESFLVQHTENT